MNNANGQTLAFFVAVPVGLVLLMVLVAIGTPIENEPEGDAQVRATLPATATVDSTATPTAQAAAATTPQLTTTPQNNGQMRCAWRPGAEPLPEITDQFRSNLDNESFSQHHEVRITAEAYGEDCLDPEGQGVRFQAQQTDFTVTIQLDASGTVDESRLNSTARAALRLLRRFPPQETPGAQEGRVELVVQAGEQVVRRLRTSYSSAVEAAEAETNEASTLIGSLGGWTFNAASNAR